jgi:hypothetical protein
MLDGDPWADSTALHRRLAYVPGEVNLWPQLTGGEVIDLLGRLRGGVDRVRRDEMLQRFELDPTKKGTAYSRGNRQKVALVAALASDVELLILDEPTGVGAVAAQLTASARAARALAIGALAVAYLLRAAGDSTGEAEAAWPTWLSPIGWAQQIRHYAGDRWALALRRWPSEWSWWRWRSC